jgi:hypothetical protein
MDHIEIHFHPMEIKAFNKCHGYWSKYAQIQKDGLTTLTVTPELRAYRPSGTMCFVRVDCLFDETAFPEETYGMVYGDEEFEDEIGLKFNEIFSMDLNLSYTEQGMQEEGLISMEVPSEPAETLYNLSNHQIIKLANHPAIREMIVAGQVITASKSPDSR